MTEATQRHQDDQRDRAQRFRTVFTSLAGQAVLEDIKTFCRYGTTKIGEDAAGRIDPGKSLVLCGMETVAIYIQDQLDFDPGAAPVAATAEMGDEK